MGTWFPRLIIVFCLPLVVSACSGYRTTVLPRLAVSEDFTDNVALSSSDPQSAFVTTVTPGATVSVANPAREVAFSYDPSVTHYATDQNEIANRQNASLRVRNNFSQHTRLEVDERFLRVDDPLAVRDTQFTQSDNPQSPEDTTRETATQPYLTNTTTGRLVYDFGPKDSIFLRYVNQIRRNEDPTEEDSTRHEGALGLDYWFGPRYGIESRAIYTRGLFTEETDPFSEYQWDTKFIRKFTPQFDVFARYIHTFMRFDGSVPDYSVYDTTIGVDYNLSPDTFLTVSGGLFFRDLQEAQGDLGYILRGEMAKRFSRGSIRLTGGTGYRNTFFGAEDLGFTQFMEGRLGGTYNFTRRLKGDLDVGYTHNTFKDTTNREDDLYYASAGLSFVIRPWLISTLRLSHRTSESTEAGDSYEENRISLGLTFSPPLPFLVK